MSEAQFADPSATAFPARRRARGVGLQQFDTSYTGAMIFLTVLLLSAIVIYALRKVEITR